MQLLGREHTGVDDWMMLLHLHVNPNTDDDEYVAKTKVLISCMDTAQLICVFAFAYIYMQKQVFSQCGSYISQAPHFGILRSNTE